MKRILLLLGLGALFTAFFINIGGVDLLPDWLGSLFFALGVTGLGRRPPGPAPPGRYPQPGSSRTHTRGTRRSAQPVPPGL